MWKNMDVSSRVDMHNVILNYVVIVSIYQRQ